MIAMASVYSYEKFINVFSFEASKTLKWDHVYICLTSLPQEFKLLLKNGEKKLFKHSSAPILIKSIDEDEAILVNKRNDPKLAILPLEDLIEEKLK